MSLKIRDLIETEPSFARVLNPLLEPKPEPVLELDSVSTNEPRPHVDPSTLSMLGFAVIAAYVEGYDYKSPSLSYRVQQQRSVIST